MDFGLFGVLITMFSLAVLLHILQRKANRLGENQKFEVLYIVVLGRMLVLFEEGADFPMIIFLVALVYALFAGNLVPSISEISGGGISKYKQRKSRGLLHLQYLYYLAC